MKQIKWHHWRLEKKTLLSHFKECLSRCFISPRRSRGVLFILTLRSVGENLGCCVSLIFTTVYNWLMLLDPVLFVSVLLLLHTRQFVVLTFYSRTFCSFGNFCEFCWETFFLKYLLVPSQKSSSGFSIQTFKTIEKALVKFSFIVRTSLKCRRRAGFLQRFILCSNIQISLYVRSSVYSLTVPACHL